MARGRDVLAPGSRSSWRAVAPASGRAGPTATQAEPEPMAGAARRRRDTDVMKCAWLQRGHRRGHQHAAARVDVLDGPGSFMTSAAAARQGWFSAHSDVRATRHVADIVVRP